LQWLKNPSQIKADERNNKRSAIYRRFTTKRGNMLNIKISELKKTIKTRVV
jgi:hypothetical protein